MSALRIAVVLMSLSLVGCDNSGSDVGKGYNNSQPAPGAQNGLSPGGSQTGVSESGAGPVMNSSDPAGVGVGSVGRMSNGSGR